MLVHNSNLIKEGTNDLQRQLNTLATTLKQAGNEMAEQDMDLLL